jgi:hypothetical protein
MSVEKLNNREIIFSHRLESKRCVYTFIEQIEPLPHSLCKRNRNCREPKLLRRTH